VTRGHEPLATELGGWKSKSAGTKSKFFGTKSKPNGTDYKFGGTKSKTRAVEAIATQASERAPAESPLAVC
jgi:hypothetical protein